MKRRKFFELFGLGVATAVIAPKIAVELTKESVASSVIYTTTTRPPSYLASKARRSPTRDFISYEDYLKIIM